ncbi:hypothetical protein [Arthrobacter sedimenti]|uniref:Uncharacterized protein n=1 Tax=Arthrobacter sedimenti TaxID=2694931 RepID=A0ABV8WNU7_9MICC
MTDTTLIPGIGAVCGWLSVSGAVRLPAPVPTHDRCGPYGLRFPTEHAFDLRRESLAGYI